MDVMPSPTLAAQDERGNPLFMVHGTNTAGELAIDGGRSPFALFDVENGKHLEPAYPSLEPAEAALFALARDLPGIEVIRA